VKELAAKSRRRLEMGREYGLDEDLGGIHDIQLF
jgi:hypothetical protein